VTPTYPGVYIEEIPSGVRTITSIATSITAFIGRALRGPVNEPVLINNYGDFERIFGGLWVDSTLGYAVRDFYLNGGSQAVIVRLFNAQQESQTSKASDAINVVSESNPSGGETNIAPEDENVVSESDATDVVSESNPSALKSDLSGFTNSKARLTLGESETELTLEAAYEGAWGNNLLARVEYDFPENLKEDSGKNELFNLLVKDNSSGQIEVFCNVSVLQGDSRRVDNVLKNESQLVRVCGNLNPQAKRPPESDAKLKQDLSGEDETKKKDAQAELKKQPFDSAQRCVKVKEENKVTDGQALDKEIFTGSKTEEKKQGLYALEKVDLFSLLCIPPYRTGEDLDVDPELIGEAAIYCEKRRAMLIVDAPTKWTDKNKAKEGIGQVGTNSKNAAIFFPRLKQPNPLKNNQIEVFAACGAVAGVFSRIDTQRGIWKAPAGLEATLVGVPELSVPLTDAEIGELNPLGINCLRSIPAAGRVIWGSRTRMGDDRLASEWKYISVRRLALYIQESLYRGTQWVVFEPNDEPLWAQIRLNLGSFMNNLFRQGAFQGSSPKEAYFVKCDKETTTQNDINLGIVNIVVGFAPLKPAEFVVIKFQQMAGQVAG
jgi:phage tail sheath protein FI